MDDAGPVLLIRDKGRENLPPAPGEVDNREGIEPGDEGLLVSPHCFGDQNRIEGDGDRSPEGGDAVGMQAGTGMYGKREGAGRKPGGPLHLPDGDDLSIGENREADLTEDLLDTGHIAGIESLPVEVRGDGPGPVPHQGDHVPVDGRRLPAVGDVPEGTPGGAAYLRLPCRVMIPPEAEEVHGVSWLCSEDALRDRPPRPRICPLCRSRAYLHEEGRRRELRRPVVGHLVGDGVPGGSLLRKLPENRLHPRRACRRERAGFPAEICLREIAGHVDGEDGRRLPARVPRDEEDEIRGELPVDPVGVDEPALQLMELEGDVPVLRLSPGGFPTGEEFLQVTADVPSRLVLHRVDDGDPELRHVSPMVNTMFRERNDCYHGRSPYQKGP